MFRGLQAERCTSRSFLFKYKVSVADTSWPIFLFENKSTNSFALFPCAQRVSDFIHSWRDSVDEHRIVDDLHKKSDRNEGKKSKINGALVAQEKLCCWFISKCNVFKQKLLAFKNKIKPARNDYRQDSDENQIMDTLYTLPLPTKWRFLFLFVCRLFSRNYWTICSFSLFMIQLSYKIKG